MPKATNAQAVPSFQPFSWLHDGIPYSAQNDFICLAHDISFGVQTVMQLLEQNYINKDCEEPGLLRDDSAGHLFRFAIASAGMLGMEADAFIARINEKFGQESKKQKILKQ